MSKKAHANLTLTLECEVRDKAGKLISKKRQPSKSLLKAIMTMLAGIMARTGITENSSVTIKDTSDANVSFYVASSSMDLTVFAAAGAAGSDILGIQCGTGSSGVTRDDNKLGGKIIHGNGSGDLAYGAVTVEVPNGTPPATTFRIIRTFTNNYTASITVYEIGLVVKNYWNGTSKYFLVARDVLVSPQSVPAGATLTVRYLFSVTA